ncbi:hypothetical protein LUZ60_002928 [Juncus effusus]|nr:hypothetical protein LUZ60_002928 [Juncus effusus]
MRRQRESVQSSYPNSTRVGMNHTARASSSQQSPSPSVNTHNAKRRSAMEERGKTALQDEESKKGKRTKVEIEDVDLKEIIVIDDDLEKNGGDELDFAEELQMQEVLLLSMGFDNRHVKTEPGRTDPPRDRTDTKGKKQVRFSLSKTEPGQSSKTPNPKTLNPKPKKLYCKICMEKAPIAQTFTINPCDHSFCNSCTIDYISSKIQENVSRISCPDPDCEAGILEPLLCKEILPKEVFEKWGLVLCESLVGVDEKFYCPFKDCSALLLLEGDEIVNSECPHCNRMFCAICKVPWHADLSCNEFQKLGKNERSEEDLMFRKLAKNKKWQRCPQCKMYVEKIDGCMFMKCRCGYCFCYVCARPMDCITHYCKKCRR